MGKNIDINAEVDNAVYIAKEAAKFSGLKWDMATGSEMEVRLLLNQHPYAEAIKKKIPDFEKQTGIHVDCAKTPEENYFDKVTTFLNSHTDEPDIFLTVFLPDLGVCRS